MNRPLKMIQKYSYDRDQVKAGILHIGVGNFHRAHEEYFTNKLLEDPSQRNWGICGAMLLPSDENLYRRLKAQGGEYTLTTCDPDGARVCHRIGSLVEILWAGDDAPAIHRKIADPAIKIITMTITEGGYNISKSSGKFMLQNEAVQHDLSNPHNPVTVFGHVAEGLRLRMQGGNNPITIQSCDNLQHNGDTARKAFTSFFAAQDAAIAAGKGEAALSKWVEENVSFPNSMVDRITPAVRQADIEELNRLNGSNDKAPVYCEDFIQWVIEDRFMAGRPCWERVGAEFTDDVTTYENMKLSLLNASHSLLCYPAFLLGYRKVDAAMGDPDIARLVRDFMEKDITPYVPEPKGIDLGEYKRSLISRFSNPSISDQVARLCFDGASKFPVYIMPNLGRMLFGGAKTHRLAFLFACYRHYLKYRVDDCGTAFKVDDPWLSEADWAVIDNGKAEEFLGISPFGAVPLSEYPTFVGQFLSDCDALTTGGVRLLIKKINT